MKKTVYIDTTIPSYYVDKRKELKLHTDRTQEWWDNERFLYDIYTSDFVILELSEGKYPNQDKAIKLVENIPRLEPIEKLEDIVSVYLLHKLMPSNDIRDAFHLAFASFYKMDYLITWNCEHLANAHKQNHIRIINFQLGFNIPLIITPLELLPE